MDFRRLLPAKRSHGGYDKSVRDVLGTPGRREVDALALVWAHTLAWASHPDGERDEARLLSQSADRYGVPLSDVLDERARQLSAPPVIPATRPTAAKQAPDRLERPA